jgi:hypothetical protein
MELGLERVNAIVAHAFDVENFDTTFALFDPEGTLISRAFWRAGGTCGAGGGT